MSGSATASRPGFRPGPNSIMVFELPFPPRWSRRARETFSSPSQFLSSPSDSGYGSSASSPSSPRKDKPDQVEGSGARLGLWMLGDGNQSDSDDPFYNSGGESASDFKQPRPTNISPSLVDFQAEPPRPRASSLKRHEPTTTSPSRGPSQKRPKPSTLPIRSARTRPSIKSFASDTGTKLSRRGSSSNVGLARSKTGSLRLLDRFIPARSNSADTLEKFKTGKAPHELTQSEKLLRHRDGVEDAFCYRRRAITPMAADYRSQSLSDNTMNRTRGMPSFTHLKRTD